MFINWDALFRPLLARARKNEVYAFGFGRVYTRFIVGFVEASLMYIFAIRLYDLALERRGKTATWTFSGGGWPELPMRISVPVARQTGIRRAANTYVWYCERDVYTRDIECLFTFHWEIRAHHMAHSFPIKENQQRHARHLINIYAPERQRASAPVIPKQLSGYECFLIYNYVAGRMADDRARQKKANDIKSKQK